MRTVLYPGSFDPVTNGHIDVAIRASTMFDRVIVAVARNGEKSPMFTFEERKALIEQACLERNCKNIEVASIDGLLAHSLEQFDAVAVIRGLRAVSDFEYEFQMALMNRELNKKCETIFLMPSPEYSFVSSRLIREIASYNGDVTSFVPHCVAQAMKKKFGK